MVYIILQQFCFAYDMGNKHVVNHILKCVKGTVFLVHVLWSVQMIYSFTPLKFDHFIIILKVIFLQTTDVSFSKHWWCISSYECSVLLLKLMWRIHINWVTNHWYSFVLNRNVLKWRDMSSLIEGVHFWNMSYSWCKWGNVSCCIWVWLRNDECFNNPRDLKQFELLDVQIIIIENECFSCSECLFQSSLSEIDTICVHEIVFNSIMECDIDDEKRCYQILMFVEVPNWFQDLLNF